MKKILYLTDLYDLEEPPFGGTQRWLNILMKAVKSQGYKPTVVSLGRLSRPWGWVKGQIPKKLKGIIPRIYSGYDIVHCFNLKKLGRIALKIPAKLRVYSSGSTEWYTIDFDATILDQFDVITAKSNIAKKRMEAFTDKPIEVIPNGVDRHEFTFNHNRKILSLGIRPIKNNWLFLEACRKADAIPILCDNIPPSKIYGLYKKVALYGLTNFYGDCPNAILEANSFGIPAVVPKGDGGAEIIEQTGGGVICNLDVDSFAEALRSLLDNEGERLRIAKLGYENILKFSTEKMIERYLKLYTI